MNYFFRCDVCLVLFRISKSLRAVFNSNISISCHYLTMAFVYVMSLQLDIFDSYQCRLEEPYHYYT
ncbi:hypothetical protein A483_HHAL012099 [Halyomorpha halys]|nr:hypothetical protein A483_HHAL012099 [Halyomorpha halys]